MSAYAEARARLRRGDFFVRDVLGGAGVAGLAVVLGASIAKGWMLPVFGSVFIALAFAAGIINWRRWTLALLIVLPVSGIPILIAYPNTAPAALLKDLLFVFPIYAGFAIEMLRRRQRIGFDGAPIALLLLLVLLIVAQALHSGASNLLVAVIGLKVWLLYVPLLFVGYHLVATKADVYRLLRLMGLVAIVPAIVGIVEAVLIYGGKSATVYSFYGDAAGAATQDYAQLFFSGGGSSLRRVPSTFSFVAQYANFLLAMVAVTYAWWASSRKQAAQDRVAPMVCFLVLIACFLSGSRSPFVFVPLIILTAMLLDRGPNIRTRKVGGTVSRLAAVAAAFLLAVSVIGTTGSGVASQTRDTLSTEFNDVFVNGFRNAFDLTTLGLGTGTDTSASRYAYGLKSGFETTGGHWYESWYVKAMLELGVLGLILVLIFLLAIGVEALRLHRELRDPSLRSVSAGLLAFFIWVLLAGIKGQYLDFDPVNVYFWLLVGVLFKLAVIDRMEAIQ
jgi:hypothetical protein